MAYGWIIDTDHATEGLSLPSRVGWVGPRGIPKRIEEQLRAGQGVPFRMFCEDEPSPCYTGRFLADANDDDVTEMEPLDDLGTPDSGCTEIAYLRAGGVWERINEGEVDR